MPPRSILKSIPSYEGGNSQKRAVKEGHVRFPPSSELAATYYAHSSSYYDRSPLVVAPNECALPRRNCPDRTYVLCDSRGEARLLKHVESPGTQLREYETKGHLSGSSYPSSRSRPDYFSHVPPPCSSRVPDLTWSESDDSDGLMSPPGAAPSLAYSDTCSPYSERRSSSSPSSENALAFLPHALPPVHQRKRSPSPRERQRKERTYSSSEGEYAPSSSRRPRPRRTPPGFTPDVPPDYGCLGGF